VIALVVSHEIHLKERPFGMPTNEIFERVEVQIPEARDGEFLVRNIWMSVDPYMRGRTTRHVPPFELGKALEGGCLGKVVESKNNQFAVGDYVLGTSYATSRLGIAEAIDYLSNTDLFHWLA